VLGVDGSKGIDGGSLIGARSLVSRSLVSSSLVSSSLVDIVLGVDVSNGVEDRDVVVVVSLKDDVAARRVEVFKSKNRVDGDGSVGKTMDVLAHLGLIGGQSVEHGGRSRSSWRRSLETTLSRKLVKIWVRRVTISSG
jgi:hypothetical protein